jgi:predicted phosphodiesterase
MGQLTRTGRLAKEAAEQNPTVSRHALARMLAKKYPQDFMSVEAARDALRYFAGAKGEKMRKQIGGTDQRRKETKAPPFPKSLAEKWEPFHLGSGLKVLSLSDAHVPYHVGEAIESAVAWAKRRKPDVVLLNGDWADFYRASRWDQDPRHARLNEELRIVVESLEWLRKRFPKARIVYKLGNHEERWEKFIWQRAPEIYDVAQCFIESLLEFDRLGIEKVEDQRPIMAGMLPIFHGHELPKGLTSPVNQARGAFLRTNASTLTAHGHSSSMQPHPTWDKKEAFSWSQGCLCEMHPRYARINKWDWSFAWIDVAKDGQYDVTIPRITQDFRIRSS